MLLSSSPLEPIKAVALSLYVRDAPADRILALFDVADTPAVTRQAPASAYCAHVAHLIESRQPGLGEAYAARTPLAPVLHALEEEGSLLLMHVYLAPPSFYIYVFQPTAQPPGCLFLTEQIALALVARGPAVTAPVCVQVVRESASAGALPPPPVPVPVGESTAERICWTNASAYARAVPTAAVALAQLLLLQGRSNLNA
jgi:hypothetical protein